MKNLIYFIILFCSATAFAQNPSVITGKIIDVENNNEPLAFGDVTVKGTDISTYSNLDGIYVIEKLAPGDYILEYSFVGYETKEINIKVTHAEPTEVNVTLNAKTPPQFKVVSNITTDQESKANPSL